MEITQFAIDSFLSRYRNQNTVDLYTIDLKIFTDWCERNTIKPLEATRVQLEAFSRYLSVERNNSDATVAHRLGVIRFFYEVALDDDLITKNPARLLRVPRVHSDTSKMVGLDRREFGALLTVAKNTNSTLWALVALLGLMGLRVTEACSINIEDFKDRIERGHQVLTFVGKGSKPATAPIPIPVLRALEECTEGRDFGPLLLKKSGERLDRRTAYRWVKSCGKKAGIKSEISPHTLRRTYVTLALDAGVAPREVQQGARHARLDTTMRYDVARGNLDRHTNHALSAFVAGAY